MTNEEVLRPSAAEAEALVRRLSDADTLPSSDDLRPLSTSLLQFIEPLQYGRSPEEGVGYVERLQVIELEVIGALAVLELRPFIEASALRSWVQALRAEDVDVRDFAHYVEALFTWQRVYEAKEADYVR